MSDALAIENFELKGRSSLPQSISLELLGPTRQEWQDHVNYAGMAQVFVEFHLMLNGSLTAIKQKLELILDGASGQNNNASGPALADLATDIRSFYVAIHRHHEVEDHIYFPQFKRLFPQLLSGFTLLDKDHLILTPAIEELLWYSRSMSAGEGLAYSFLGLLYDHISVMRKILARHLIDEEEIIIPLFLSSK